MGKKEYSLSTTRRSRSTARHCTFWLRMLPSIDQPSSGAHEAVKTGPSQCGQTSLTARTRSELPAFHGSGGTLNELGMESVR